MDNKNMIPHDWFIDKNGVQRCAACNVIWDKVNRYQYCSNLDSIKKLSLFQTKLH